MFGWCKEVPLLQDNRQYMFNRNKSSINFAYPPHHLSSKNLRLPTSNTVSVLNISKEKRRKGIKIHKEEIRNQRKRIQLNIYKDNDISFLKSINQESKLIHTATQTSPKFSPRPQFNQYSQNHIFINPPIAQFTTRSVLPMLQRCVDQQLTANYRDRFISVPVTYEQKIEINKQTKSTNCYAEGQAQRIAMLNSRTIRDVQSYHQKQKITDHQDCRAYFGESLSLPIKKDYCPVYPLKSRETLFQIKKMDEENQISPSFAPKRHKILKNEKYSFFQGTSKDEEQDNHNKTVFPIKKVNKFKLTPQRRAHLMDRDTVVSKSYYDPLMSEKSLRVEESIIFQRQIKSEFISLAPSIHGVETDAFNLYLAIQKHTGLLVSIKQLSKITSMVEISDERLIYSQIESKNSKFTGILQLYQAQIDNNSYIFVKEPYDRSLFQRLTQCKFKKIDFKTEIDQTIENVREIINEAKQFGLSLRRDIDIDDIVILFGKAKIHSVTVFQIEQNGRLEQEKVIVNLKQRLWQFLQQ